MRVLALYGLFLGPAVLAVAQAPLVEPGGVVDAASFKGPVVPGSLVSIFGSNLASGTASASAIPLPVTLGGVSVSFNGIAAPLLYVSGQQINAQLPWEVSTTGPVSVVVANGTAASAPHSVQVGTFSPGLFTIAFFFSSRRRHTRLQGDWSSDVCSSDLSSGSSMTFPRSTSASSTAAPT